MGFWNYRVVRRTVDASGRPLSPPEYGIYEAFYEESERDKETPIPNALTVEPVAIVAYDEEGLRHELLEKMARALKEPTLDYESIGERAQ